MKKLIIVGIAALFLAGCSLSGLDLKVDKAGTNKIEDKVENTIEK
jgi:PBP1b-binding outer membrane lipoprotein LpoB